MGAVLGTDALLRSTQIARFIVTVVEKKLNRVLDQGQFAGLGLVASIAATESLLLMLTQKTAVYYLALLVPFRILLWTLALRVCVRQRTIAEHAQLAVCLLLPYLVSALIVPHWFATVELSKLSYYAGLIFSPAFIALSGMYAATASLALCIEVASMSVILVLATAELFCHQGLYQFWTGVVSAYFTAATEVYHLSLSEIDTAYLVDLVSKTMTCNFTVHYFLAPMLLAFLAYAYTHRSHKVRREWQNLTMSWTAFSVAVPLFFAGYGLQLAQKMGWVQSGSFISTYVSNLFDVVRFYPSVCGLSYVHYLIEARFDKSRRIISAWLGLSTLVFYSFGAFFYPIFSFLGLLDRVVNLRYTRKQAT